MSQKTKKVEIVPDEEPSEEAVLEEAEVRKAGCLLACDLAAFSAAENDQVKTKLLCELLKVKYYERNPRSKIYIDYCFLLLGFGLRDAGLDDGKMVVLFDIGHQVFELMTTMDENENWRNVKEVYMEFSNMVRKSSADVPPDFKMIFTIEDVKVIVAYFSIHVFRQFSMYQLMFKRAPVCVEVEYDVFVDSPLKPLPLSIAQLEVGTVR